MANVKFSHSFVNESNIDYWKDRIQNEEIRLKIEVTSIDEKMRENRLRWFDHVQRRATNELIRKK